MLMFGRSKPSEWFEFTTRWDVRCFSCRTEISAGSRCFAARPSLRRAHWGYCCWTCASDRGWVVDRKQKTYDRAPAGSYWWERYG
jgi:hypothetical protein